MSITLPALFRPRTDNLSLDRWVAAVTERLEVREGGRGLPDEQVITVGTLPKYSASDVATMLSTTGEGFQQRQADGTYKLVSATDLSEILLSTPLFLDVKNDIATLLTDNTPERVRLLVQNGLTDADLPTRSEYNVLRNQLVATASTSGASAIFINVKDAPYNAIGDGVADDTAAIQAAIAAGQAAGLNGGVVYLPAGKYKVTSNLNITWPSSTTSFDNTGKVVLRGAGAGLSAILDYRTSVGTGGCVTYDFSTTGAGAAIDYHYLFTWTGGFSLIKSVNATVVAGGAYTTMGTGIGLYVNNIPAGFYQDMVITGYATNMQLTDALGTTIRDCYFNACNIGLEFVGQVSLSEPTATEVSNMIMSACKTWAIKAVGGGPLAVNMGTYSDVGFMGTTSGAIYYENSTPLNMAKGLTVDGSYFERNRGTADIYITTESGRIANISNTVSNCSFQRNSSAVYTTNLIRVNAVGTTTMQLLVYGNGFRSYTDYVPNAGRPCVGLSGTTTNVNITYIGNTFADALEVPAGASRPIGFPANGLSIGSDSIYIAKSTGGTSWLDVNNVMDVVPAAGVSPRGSSGALLMGSTLQRWANVFTVLGNFSGNVTFGASAYIGAVGGSLDLSGTASVVPGGGGGLFPAVNNTQALGATSFRWTNITAGFADLSSTIKWGAYTYAVPTGSTTTFLRNDGTWAAPAATLTNAVTFNNGGAGAASGTTFDGTVARTISHNTIGAYAASNPSGFTSNTGTVTSVGISGGTTGLTASAAITTSGNITLSGTLAKANGGTGNTVGDATTLGGFLPGNFLRFDSVQALASATRILRVNINGIMVDLLAV